MDAIQPHHVATAREAVKRGDLVGQRRNTTGGLSAAESMVAAVRRLYQVAVSDTSSGVTVNPAKHVTKPLRALTERRPLEPDELVALFELARPHETHMLRFMIETGLRRSGLCSLKDATLDLKRQTLKVVEKGSQPRSVPFSAEVGEILADPQTASCSGGRHAS